MAKKKKYNHWYGRLLYDIIMIVIILLLIGGVFWFAYSKGWWPFRTQETFIEIETPSTSTAGTTIDLIDNCNDLCSSEGWSEGWVSTRVDGQDCLDEQAIYTKYGYPNQAALLKCCCDNVPKGTNTIDTDGDGIPDTTDTDDDNDGWTDEEEIEAGTDPLDANSTPFDCSGYCQNLDTPHSELYDGFYTATLPVCEDISRELCETNHIHIYNRGGNNCCCLVCLDANHQPHPY